MNNKFSYLFQGKLQQPTVVKTTVDTSENFIRDFEFKFTSGKNSFKDLITEDLSESWDDPERRREGITRRLAALNGSFTGGPIVKSDIKESVFQQLTEMLEIIKETHKELECLKMNRMTQNKFRMYHSYEVSYISKGMNKNEHGVVIGAILGVPIVADNSLKDNIVRPVIKITVNSVRNKLQKIFQIKGDVV